MPVSVHEGQSTTTASITVDVRQQGQGALPTGLFGFGVDYLSSTYIPPNSPPCPALLHVAGVAGLIRIGADTADDYDWRSDTIYPHRNASFPCAGNGPAASLLRVLDRVQTLHLPTIVVLNGEIDDPQSAADLIRLIVKRYGLHLARQIYWEIGASPSRWQHFGIPITQRSSADSAQCLPDQYAALVTSYAAAVAAALREPPTGSAAQRPRIVASDWIANATDQSWTGVVTAVDTTYAPFNSPDSAPTSAADIARSISSRLASLDQQLDSLRANLAQYAGGQSLPLIVGQWNIDANPQAQFSPSITSLYNSPGQAVFVARVLMRLALPRNHVLMAAWASPLYTYPQSPLYGGQATRGFAVFAALHRLAGATVLSPAASRLPDDLDVIALRPPGRHLAVVIANAATHSLSLDLRLKGLAQHHATVTRQILPGNATTKLPLDPAHARISISSLSVVLLMV